MKNERERLVALLTEGKISEQEFSVLSRALSKESGVATMDLIFNPFRRVAGVHALIMGLIGLIFMSALAPVAQIHYPGILDLQIAKTLKEDLATNMSIILYQNLINTLAFGIVAFLGALILKQRDIRFIDFVGMAALARLAYFPITVLLVLVALIKKDIILNPQSYPFVGLAIAVLAIPSVIWMGILYFNAYREASGLKSRRLWISFFVAVVVGEAISAPLTRIFLD